MRTKMIAAAVAASAALLVAGCGGDDDDTSSGTTPADTAATEADSGSAGSVLDTGDTDLGEVLTDAAGLTLYGFTEDSPGSSSCDGECAVAWPPLTVDSAEVPAGLDAAEYSVIERSDGTFQLAVDDMALYTFGGDGAPGDVNGQGVGGTWFAVDGAGQLLQDVEAGSGSGDSGSGDSGY
jgi:predicted lipoprotein with Yx(FWY)xxD motif